MLRFLAYIQCRSGRLTHFLLLENLEKLYQQLPELINGRDLQTLVGRVYATERRTKRNHLQVGVLLQEQTTLQTCVDSAHLRLGSEQLTVALYAGLEQS